MSVHVEVSVRIAHQTEVVVLFAVEVEHFAVTADEARIVADRAVAVASRHSPFARCLAFVAVDEAAFGVGVRRFSLGAFGGTTEPLQKAFPFACACKRLRGHDGGLLRHLCKASEGLSLNYFSSGHQRKNKQGHAGL
eukprot:TRINITY_DN11188_c0_g1_i1.p2 TRINITY_DN11188_c0_g1~~TRINITY_DN11188_c0_g1_i1.p2  ORF type:complete len:137 (+),score=1.31 TRINITY_DN11188_c0_g1_i1:330-740(+)